MKLSILIILSFIIISCGSEKQITVDPLIFNAEENLLLQDALDSYNQNTLFSNDVKIIEIKRKLGI